MSETKTKLTEKFLLELLKNSDLTPEEDQTIFKTIEILRNNVGHPIE